MWVRYFLIFLLLLLNLNGFGATINAVSASSTDVQDAINRAADAGDIVIVPSGNATWSVQVDILNKGLELRGAGVGSTVITKGSGSAAGNSILYIKGYHTNVVWVHGFTWQTGVGTTYGMVTAEAADHFVPDARVYVSDCQFDVFGTGGITRRTLQYLGCYGLVWKCHFALTNASSAALPELDINAHNSLTNHYHVPLSTIIGTTNQLIIEDCTSYNDDVSGEGYDTYAGSMTVRYCTVTNSVIGNHGADSAFRGPMLNEWYGNHFYRTAGANPVGFIMQMRGGTAVIWSNVVHNWAATMILRMYRCDPEYWTAENGGTPPGSNFPDGKAHDGNFNLTYPSDGYAVGYPTLDQCGRGPFPSAALPDCTSGCTIANFESLAPVYFWGNNLNGDTSPLAEVIGYFGTPNNATNYIKAGRDYYDNTQMPNYISWTYPDPRRAQFEGASNSSEPATIRKFKPWFKR